MDNRKKQLNVTAPTGKVGVDYSKRYEVDGVKMVPVDVVVKGDVPENLADKLTDYASEALG